MELTRQQSARDWGVVFGEQTPRGEIMATWEDGTKIFEDMEAWLKLQKKLLAVVYIVNTINTVVNPLEAPSVHKQTYYPSIIFQSLYYSYSFHIKAVN